MSLTKRLFSSSIAKLFELICWVAPVTIRTKILMRRTWILGSSWDAALPEEIQVKWREMVNDLKQLGSLRIPRYYGSKETLKSSTTKLSLIGFSDASEEAYSACIYLGIYTEEHEPIINLIEAKTRVAPCNNVSIPRLELCRALLLAELMPVLQKALKLPIYSTSYWTDSTITLGWFRGHPSKKPTFVANRVTKVQELSSSNDWGYVKGQDNPAECASRGISAADLINHPLWWHGPAWLKDGIPNPLQSYKPKPPKEEPISLILDIQHRDPVPHFMERFSDLHRLIRVTSRLLHYRNKFRPQHPFQEDSSIDIQDHQVLVKWTLKTFKKK